MSKKFASFLMAGKVASMVTAQNSHALDGNALLQALTGQTPHIVEVPAQGIVVNTTVESATSAAAKIVTPGANCANKTPPSTVMNVVITGVSGGDWVILAAADDSNYPDFLSINPAFTIGNTNSRILASFVMEMPQRGIHGFASGGGDLSKSAQTISIPVDLRVLTNPAGFYIQAIIVKPNGQLAFSELDRIERTTENCSTYGGGYSSY